MKEKTINFGNLLNDLKKEKVKIVFIKNRGCIFLEDSESNLYVIEISKNHSYLDGLIEKREKVKFYIVDKNISKNIKDWEKDVWSLSDVEDFMKKCKLINSK